MTPPLTTHRSTLLSACSTTAMTPEEITTVFAMAATILQPISGQPSDDALTTLQDLLYFLLINISHDEDGTHNLHGIIKPTTLYMTTWGTLFPPLPCPPAYNPSLTMQQQQSSGHAAKPNMSSFLAALPAMKRLNVQQQSSSGKWWTRSDTVTCATNGPSTHTSWPNNFSPTLTTTAAAYTPMNLPTSQRTCWDSMQWRMAPRVHQHAQGSTT